MSAGRLPTGIAGFDPLINGGFPKGSLILIAGNPGTGKTIFAAQFLHTGAELGEPGVYVSFAESWDTFRENMRGLGLDFNPLEEEGIFKFLDMVTVKEVGVSTIFELILDELESMKARRMVIDPYTVLAQAFKEKIEARVFIHTILSRIIRRKGCTTLIVSEIPIGQEEIGLGVEEFVADGIIELSYDVQAVYPRRKIKVRKLRGNAHSPYIHDFSIKTGRGLEVLPIHRPPSERIEEAVSTGIPQIDEILGGGLPRGSIYLFELDSGIDQLTYETNFLRNVVSAGEAYVQIINSALSPKEILRGVERAGIKKEFDEQVKGKNIVLFDFFDRIITEEMGEYVIPIVEFSPDKILSLLGETFKRFEEEGKKIRLESDLSDMLSVIGEEAFLHLLPRIVAYIKEYEGVWLGTFKPKSVRNEIAEKIRSSADGIIKIWSEGGYNFIQVIKSKNKIYSRPLRYIETTKPPFIEILE